MVLYSVTIMWRDGVDRLRKKSTTLNGGPITLQVERISRVLIWNNSNGVDDGLWLHVLTVTLYEFDFAPGFPGSVGKFSLINLREFPPHWLQIFFLQLLTLLENVPKSQVSHSRVRLSKSTAFKTLGYWFDLFLKSTAFGYNSAIGRTAIEENWYRLGRFLKSTASDHSSAIDSTAIESTEIESRDIYMASFWIVRYLAIVRQSKSLVVECMTIESTAIESADIYMAGFQRIWLPTVAWQ